MGRLMSVLANPNNNIHESNPIYNYKFPTSISNNFNDNYFFCGYKCRKNNSDKLVFEGERYLSNFEVCNNLPSLPMTFATEGVIPIVFNIFPHRNSFKLIQCDKPDKVKLQFIFDCENGCQIDVYYCAFEKFSSGKLSYTLKHNLGRTNSTIYPAGSNQFFDYQFDDLEIHDHCDSSDEFGELIPFVVVLSTIDDGIKDRQQFVTHLCFESKSENQTLTSAQVTVQKLVYKSTCFLMQDMYGADLLTEQETLQNFPNNDLKSPQADSESNYLTQKSKSDIKQSLFVQDCVICMSSVRDTLVLPCRHLCLCSTCGDKLLHQSPACPICRCAFRALLQIENLEKYLLSGDLK